MNPDKWLTTKTDIATTFRVDIKTARKWLTQPWFPKRHARHKAWSRAACVKAVDTHNKAEQKRITGDGLLDEKRRLECDKLRVVIKSEKERLAQAQMETAKQRGQVWQRDEVLRSWSERNRRIMARVEAYRGSKAAKLRTAKSKRLIDELCDGVVAELREEFRT